MQEYEKGLRGWREHSELNSLQTTEIYTHVTITGLKKIKSPLDDLKIEIVNEHKKVVTNH